MNYWIISPNVSNQKVDEDAWKKAILTNNVAIMGWGSDHQLGQMFIDKIKLGDIILIAQGANKQKKLLLAGKVCSPAFEQYLPNTPNKAWYRNLKGVVKKEELDVLSLDFNGAAYGDSNQPTAIYQLKPSNNDADKLIAKKLMEKVAEVMLKEERKPILNLLRYKKQIILQGPPGTGKTKLAKELAKDLVVPIKGIKAKDTIINFLKKFESNSTGIKNEVLSPKDLLGQFYKHFPKDKLLELTKEDYAIGTGANNSFCWWIERGLKPLGYYFPGSARSYLIYYKKELEDYSIHGKFQKENFSADEAMVQIAQLINDLVNNKNFEEARNYFGDGFLLKVLHSYYPDIYFPVNSIPCMENILKLFEIEPLGLNALQMNLKIQNYFADLKNETGSSATNHDFMRFLFRNFNINGKLEIEQNEVVTKGEYKIVQFHPSYSYEDFVRGVNIEIVDRQPNYVVKNKVLANFAETALNNPSSNFVLIIDEINRANLTTVLGELIYALEYRFDENKVKETSVESIYGLKNDGENIEDSYELKLPKNLYIIGTMNTADRSVGHIDYAIRRRFAFVDVLPKELEHTDNLKFNSDLFKKVSALFISNYEAYVKDNDIQLERAPTLSPEFDPKDVWLGHSYFIDKSDEGASIEIRLQYEIKPILNEYVKDGILIGDDILKTIANLSA